MDARTVQLAKIMGSVSIQRARVRLGRVGEGANLSHLKQIDMIRRAVEKAGWPAARTQGKKPKLKLSFGPAIAVGYESEAEYFDVDLQARMDLSDAQNRLQPHLAMGYRVLGMKSIPRFFPSLEEVVNVVVYEIYFPALEGTLPRWEDFWKKEQFMVVKKKEDRDVVLDARPLVRRYLLEGNRLELELRFGPGRTVKPELLLQSVAGIDVPPLPLDGGQTNLRIKRKGLFLEKSNGDLMEP